MDVGWGQKRHVRGELPAHLLRPVGENAVVPVQEAALLREGAGIPKVVEGQHISAAEAGQEEEEEEERQEERGPHVTILHTAQLWCSPNEEE